MTALLERVGFEVDAIDVFCGFGGSSQGIHAAGATVIAAANHNELSLECHARNFPDTDHWHADLVDSANPQVVNAKGKKVAGRYLSPKDLPRARFAWFSPSCTHHSQANAKKIYERGLQIAMFEDDDWDEQEYVNSERSRVTMSCVLNYTEHNRPEIIVVENVIEVTKWGPGRNGATFRWWMGELDKLGYDLELCFLNSMFFPPCPQSRDRLYVVVWRKGNKKPDLDFRPAAYCISDRCGGRHVEAVQTWKRPTAAWMGLRRWGKYRDQYDYRCPDCRQVVNPASWMALSAIDLSNLGPTLGEREKPVAPNTRERVRRCIKKFWHAPPVMLPAEWMASTVQAGHGGGTVSTTQTHSPKRYDSNRSKHVGEHLPALTAHNSTGVALIPIRSGRPRSNHAGEQLATVVGEGSHHALAMFIKNNGDATEVGYRGHHAGLPLGAIVGSARPQSVAVLPNRTHNVGDHAAGSVAPVMAGTVSQAVVVAAAGHTFERGDYSRGRHHGEQLFTQSATGDFAVAALPTLRGDHPQEIHAGEGMGTVSAGGYHQALASFSKINGGPADTDWHLLDDTLNSVTSRDTHGLVLLPWIDQWRSEPALLTEQLATVTSHLRQSLASIEPYEGEITDELLDQVRFRMLTPDPELRRAMAFGDHYELIGTKTQMTAGLGNAVTPPVASWITGRCLATLRGTA